jgi:serine/threonine-protein kinase
VQYTPLEQYGGDTGHTDVRSDIYSLGATLYHLLTGQPPLDAKARFLRPNSLPTVRSLNPSVSPQTERAIVWSLAMHPDERPGSIAEFQAELFAPSPVSRAVGSLLNPERPVARFIRANQFLILLFAALLLGAALITARPALIPPAPTPVPTLTAPVPAPTSTRTPRPTRTVVPTTTSTPTSTPTPSRTPTRWFE